MNRASSSRYQANVIVLRSFRVAVSALLVCLFQQHVTLTAAKVFERCELAQVLRYGHGVDVNDVANWVCIAQHSSSLDTSAFRGNAKIGSHGIFQLSDEYWCSPPGKGVGCGVSCDRLRDDDISDDFECVRKIHAEHQGLSGDGFNAWNAYQLYCKDNPYEYIEDCFGNEEREYIRSKSITTNYVRDEEEESFVPTARGKVYGRCELAKELFLKHKIPMDEIPTWVCIAQHESNYDTSAVGRLNADGSADHGLFQISDLFWCSKKGGQRKACGVPCSKFLDSDITDDVKCVRQIYKEHTRISGDGFNAWTVYNAHCHEASEKYIRGCFDGIDIEEPKPLEQYRASEQYRAYTKPSKGDGGKPHGKVYDACELADDLRNKYHLPEDQIATWVCIAKHESGYNTSAIGYGDHGLFQISDIYWCSPPGKGWACGLSCSDLEDSDISDDVACIQKIYDEHLHLSGDGFKAWTVYPRFCSEGRAEKYISHCPSYGGNLRGAASQNSYSQPISSNSIEDYQPVAKGKVYGRCELANELENKYHMPPEDIPTWVCIAQHESNFKTSAVGRLNADGSADHGLFQISDLFWCSNNRDDYGKACGLPCSKLLDSDISDDIECVKQIHEEHTRLTGDGFNAWSVYNPYCKDQSQQYTRGCSDGSASIEDFEPVQRTTQDFGYQSKNKPKGKVYEDCELAKELRDKHRIPTDQISSWVCIAKHQSGLNTSASSADSHGLFYISDEFWCSPPGKGKACELNCADLEDSDITDDVQCVKKIYEEHQRIYGNGFNAWRVYDQYCSNGKADDYTRQCQGFGSTSRNSITYGGAKESQYKFGGRALDITKPVFDNAYSGNPFLKRVNTAPPPPPPNQFVANANPFFNQFQSVNLYQGSASEDNPSISKEYVNNPFLKNVQSATKKPIATFQLPATFKPATFQPATFPPITFPPVKVTTTAAPLWKNPFLQTTTVAYPVYNPFKAASVKASKRPGKPFAWSASLPTMSEERAKYEMFKTFTTPAPPAFTVTPKANRLQPYHLNTIQPEITPFWLTTTTPRPINPSSPISVVANPFWPPVTQKPTSRFQFFETTTKKPTTTTTPFWRTPPSTTLKPTSRFQFFETTPQKSVAVTPFWLTSTTTQKPTTRLNTVSPFGAVPFWLASTTKLPPTTIRFQNKTLPTTVIPFWQTLPTTTQKPTSRLSTALPFWQTTPTTKKLTTNIFQQYQTNTFRFTNPTTSTTKPPISSKIIPLALPTLQTAQVKTSTKSSPSTTTKSSAAKHSGQYDPGRYNSGKYNSGRYEAPKNNPSTLKPTTLKTTTRPPITIRTTSSTTKSPWSTRGFTTTTSKTTKYDPFRQFQFPPTTLKPKTTTKSSFKTPTTTWNNFTKNSATGNTWNWRSTSTTTPLPSVNRNYFQFNSTLPKLTTIKPSLSGSYSWTTSTPYSYQSIRTTLATTKTPTNRFSFQYTTPLEAVTSSTSRLVSKPTTSRSYVVPTISQIQKSTTLPTAAGLQTIIPPWAVTTTQPPTTTVKPSSGSTSNSKSNVYDLYFKLYGVQPPSVTKTAR
ncbi:uncharacterized protein LOC129943998 [Eupeodes corollae]|uniref:uncharacterized protein LOC129943998 n=1 Tax=Eupeodes corollae TaxID=290404 RepID=UPI00248F89E8|nr:uncharacterized protein LOC129943998 [Eupeodes corollae]